MWPKQYNTLSSRFFFSSFSHLRFLCWHSRFCCSSLGTSSLLSKWCTLNSRKTKTKWRSCETPPPGVLAAVPLPAAGAGFGMDPAINPSYAVDGLGSTHPFPCLAKDTDSASTDSVLRKHGSPVCGPAIYVYLIQNVFAFVFFCI